ncbi:MAG TPA: hypothetical protein EYG82_07685 [Sulfurovum sp.]|nr:hypothetical protein [Sulfurovum sp.]
MKKLGLTGIVLGALLLSGCGGSGSSDGISNKKVVIIYEDLPGGICESAQFRTNLAAAGFQDFNVKETGRSTTCKTYGKTEDVNCFPYLWTGDRGNYNCVVGANSARQGKVISESDVYETLEIAESKLQ